MIKAGPAHKPRAPPPPAAILFEASMEFLQTTTSDEDHDDEDSFVMAPLPPVLPPIADETLPLRCDHGQREGLVGAVAMGGRLSGTSVPVFEDYYAVRLRGRSQVSRSTGSTHFNASAAALTDDVLVDAIFLPHSSSPAHQHSNTWTSILAHGAFSSDTPPPSPGTHTPSPGTHTPQIKLSSLSSQLT